MALLIDPQRGGVEPGKAAGEGRRDDLDGRAQGSAMVASPAPLNKIDTEETCA
jgi:hypothetical protein